MDTDSGEISIDGNEINSLSRAEMRLAQQNPDGLSGSLCLVESTGSGGDIIAQGPITQGIEKDEAIKRARELISIVGLDARAFDRFPHEFSGGQRQRIGIARSLALKPEIRLLTNSFGA